MSRTDKMTRWAKNQLDKPSRAATAVALAGVAALAVSAVLVRQQTRRTERLNRPTGRFLKVDGVHLHYIERGEGEALVLLHGNGSMASEFEVSGLMDRASQRYRVIAFDRPGFGHSDRPHDRIWTPEAQAALLHRALTHLGVEKAVIYGHSWGTQVALAMALNHPVFVKALVLESGYYFPSITPSVLPLSVPALPGVGSVIRHTIGPWIGRLLWPLTTRRMFAPSRVTRGFAERFPMWMTLRPSQIWSGAAEAALLVPAAMGLSHRYERLNVPVVLIAGEGDLVVRPEMHTERLHETLPLSEMQVVRDCGHMVHHVHPDEVMLAIDRAAQASGLESIEGVAPFGSQPKSEASNYVRLLRVAAQV